MAVGSGQAVLGGNISGAVLAGAGDLELNGEFGGDIVAYVGESDEYSPPIGMYMSNTPITLPNVQLGLMITDQASIHGNLTYTSTKELSIPARVVSGTITRTEPKYESSNSLGTVEPADKKRPLLDWSLALLRNFVTLLLFGLLLLWLAPDVVSTITGAISLKLAPVLGKAL